MMKDEKNFTLMDYVRSALSILLFFILLLLLTPVILLLLIVTFGKGSNFVVENIAPAIARPVLWVAGIRFRIKKNNVDAQAPAVYIINHASTLDILTILALGLPHIRFVAKWQFQYNPIFLILGRLTGQVFIRREKSEKAVATLQKNIHRIKARKLSLLMAPEGSRKHIGVIGPFKKGAFRMAMDLDYPIVPIYFEGNRKLSSGKFLITKKGTCTAHIFPKISTSSWDMENLEEHISGVRNLYIQWSEKEKAGTLDKSL